MSAPSLYRQLALRLTLGLLGAWVLAMLGAGAVLKSRTDAIFDSALQETAERILPLAIMEIEANRYRRGAKRGPDRDDHEDDDDHDDDHDDDDDAPRPVRGLDRPAPHSEYLTYVLRDATGRVLVYSHDADLSVFDPGAPQGMTTAEGHRLYMLATADQGYTIQAAEPLDVRRAALRATLAAMLAPLALILPLSAAGIGWVLRRGLRPVAQLSDELGRRGAQDLSPIADTPLPRELRPIREAANALFARMDRALEAERSFAANAAHELRTPIAATLAQSQRLIGEAPEGPLRERARTVAAELKRMARLAEKLMQLARAEGGGVIGAEAHDLVPVLAALVDDLARDLPQGRIALSLPDRPVLSRLDRDAFGVLARNLIENALIHGAAGGPVAVRLTAAGLLRVENDGPVIAPETLARLTERFARGETRAAGSGLGLTIAAGIARVIGADLVLRSPRAGARDGFSAELRVIA